MQKNDGDIWKKCIEQYNVPALHALHSSTRKSCLSIDARYFVKNTDSFFNASRAVSIEH